MQDLDVSTWIEKHFIIERWRGEEADIRCPQHDDRHASASININKRVWHCMACGAGGTLAELAKQLELSDLPGSNGNGKASREVARYDYRDVGGKVIYQVVRFQPKAFRQYNVATGQWSIKGLERVPYRLPELLAGLDAKDSLWSSSLKMYSDLR